MMAVDLDKTPPVCQDLSIARKPLARLRCLKECLECMRTNKPLPRALCYIPAEIEYVPSKNANVTVYSLPSKASKKISDIMCTTEHRVFVTGEELFNTYGQWGKLIKIVRGSRIIDTGGDNVTRWILLYPRDLVGVDILQPKLSAPVISATKQSLFGVQPRYINSWEEVLEHEYALRLAKVCRPAMADEAAVDKLSLLPTNWSFLHYEQMSKLLSKNSTITSISTGTDLGSVKDFVESLEVSSSSNSDEDKNNLTDSNSSTFWESDGSNGSHWIRLKMKAGTIVKKLILILSSADENYLPRRVVVMGGSVSNLSKLSDVAIDTDFEGFHDAVVLSDQSEHHECIEIRIKECKDGGIDTRIHGIKILSSGEKEMGFNKDSLSLSAVAEFPLLDGFDIEILYQKAVVMHRILKLLDSVLPLLLPRWEYSLAPFASLETARELLTLSKKRSSLVDHFLRESETLPPSSARKVHIDRRAAMEHRTNPTSDPEYRKSVFNQLYEYLKPREAGQKALDYRWPVRFNQWWECKFIGEGIIDQGGGFRDSLSDLAEELCPSNSDGALPLPFFIRSPNQTNEDASNFRDHYIPNPSCTEYLKLEWIGKLMGACFRGKENLVLSLAPFVWKSICDRPVSWQHDFVTVDEAQVKQIELMKTMSQEEFEAYFGNTLTWSLSLTNGNVVHLSPAHGDSSSPVSYEDRLEYARLIEDIRMTEHREQVSIYRLIVQPNSADQRQLVDNICDQLLRVFCSLLVLAIGRRSFSIKAIRNGLLQVVPEAALELFTWHEVEKRICGDPEIPLEMLRKSVMLDGVGVKDDPRVKMMWEVLEKFTNEDRSHYLRFVTGRRRLPATVHVISQESTDVLPTSSTCGSALFLPRYTSVKIMEEKLRYAIYNCIAIDTDTTAHTFDGGHDYYF